ncbi:hypothetical protein ACWC4D_15570 [Streptomyces sp. NPDC001288]|uniref:hypothetical protein n=1 Tax=Streptomyces sp. NPDC001297 TaxID=3364559 RepID=UPI0036A3D647
MNRWIRRVSIAVTSTALAGGALLGAVGPASAAMAPGSSAHAQSSSSAAFADASRSGHRDGRHLSFQDGRHRQQAATASVAVSGERWYLDQIAWDLHQH